MEKNLINLQKYGEVEPEEENVVEDEPKPESKTFTQAEVDDIVNSRVIREKAKAEKEIRQRMKDEDIERKKKSFEQLDQEEKDKKLRELEFQQLKDENENLKLQQHDLEVEKVKNSILSTYATDGLPCSKEFQESGIVEMLSNIEDNELLMQTYNGIKNLINGIESKYRKEVVKQGVPKVSSTENSNVITNPFKIGNLTEMNAMILNDRDKAFQLAKEAGVDKLYFPKG